MAIETFVFLDIEATGLPEQELNRTKATELVFLAVSRCHLQAATVGSLPPTKKLSFIFNPQRKLQPNAAKVTGFTDEFLAGKPLFRDKIEELNRFLDLPRPVCLVAHCGDKFDFKILRAEYHDVRQNLPAHLLCVDSLKVFKEIFKRARAQRAAFENITESMSKLGSREEVSLTLPSLYRTLLVEEPPEPPGAAGARAEADCTALLRCVVALKEDFLLFADINYKPLNMIKPLKRRLYL